MSPRPKMYDYNQSVSPLRAVVLGYVLGRKIATKDEIAEARIWVERIFGSDALVNPGKLKLAGTGGSGSCNQFKLAVTAGFIFGMLPIETITAVVEGESRCCWYRAKCGTPNEQPPDLTHAALNFLCDAAWVLLGIPGADILVARVFNLIRAIDVYRTGHGFAAGARSSHAFAKARRTGKLPVADAADPMARAILGERLELSNKPSSQDAVAVIQRGRPDLIDGTVLALGNLPPLLYPLHIGVYEFGVITTLPTAPERKSRYNVVTKTWSLVDGNRVVDWGWEDEAPPMDRLGEELYTDITPQGVIG